MNLDVDANAVLKAGRLVRQHGFEVIVWRNVEPAYVWMIEISHGERKRRLAVERVYNGGEDADLALLVADPEDDPRPSGIEKRLKLTELLAEGREGIEKLFAPPSPTA